MVFWLRDAFQQVVAIILSLLPSLYNTYNITMKTAITFLALAASASAFTTSSTPRSATKLQSKLLWMIWLEVSMLELCHSSSIL